MKKKYINIFLITLLMLYIYYIFTHKNNISTNIINSCNLFFYQVFPSLFPMFIISSLLINLNAPYYFTQVFSLCNKYFHISPLKIYIIIMSLISGTPSNAFISKELYEQKQITNDIAAKLLTFSSVCKILFST